MRLSIRWRLTLWNAAVMAVVLLGFAGLVYGLMHRALYGQADQRLRASLGQLKVDERLEQDPRGRVTHWIEELFEHEGIGAVVFAPDGRVYEKTAELSPDALPGVPSQIIGEPRARNAVIPTLGRQRVLEAHVPMGGKEYAIVVMTPLEGVDKELGHVLAALALAVPAGLGVCGALAYLLARKALTPVEHLRRQTRQITADRLDRRLPVLNPDDELGRLGTTINEMIGRLERSFTEVRQFTADASHELRTPLTAIRAEAESALGNPGLAAEQQQLLGSILEECERLARLTDQLLTLSREDAGVSRPANEPVDLAGLATGVVDTMRPLAEMQGIRLELRAAGPVSMKGDGARLRQVLYNLIDNAIKHTPASGVIEVHAELQDGQAALVVRDTGEGIPPEHLPHVFDRFYRVDKARSRDQGGTGLGLSIVRSIVVAHGGDITLDSALGKGTTFTIKLPLDATERTEATN